MNILRTIKKNHKGPSKKTEMKKKRVLKTSRRKNELFTFTEIDGRFNSRLTFEIIELLWFCVNLILGFVNYVNILLV